MAKPLQWLAHIMPLYYGRDALQKVIKQGMGFSGIAFNLGVLSGVIILTLYPKCCYFEAFEKCLNIKKLINLSFLAKNNLKKDFLKNC